MEVFTAASVKPYEFGLIELRRGAVAKVAVAVGSLALIALYVAPVVRAFEVSPPARVHTLGAVVAPVLQFPGVATPAPLKVKAAPAAFQFRAPVQHKAVPRSTKVPVVTSQVDFLPPKSKPAAAPALAAQPPVVETGVGLDPGTFSASATSPTPATPSAAPATSPDPATADAAATTGTDDPDAIDRWLVSHAGDPQSVATTVNDTLYVMSVSSAPPTAADTIAAPPASNVSDPAVVTPPADPPTVTEPTVTLTGDPVAPPTISPDAAANG